MNVIRAKLCRLAKGQGHQSQLLPSWCLWQRLSECTHKHTTKYDTHAHMGEGWCGGGVVSPARMRCCKAKQQERHKRDSRSHLEFEAVLDKRVHVLHDDQFLPGSYLERHGAECAFVSVIVE